MGCGVVKCTEATCSTKLPACKMIRGKCPECHIKSIQPVNNTNNVSNKSSINR
jgi:hypothetical protein